LERTGAAARKTRAPVLLIVDTGDRQPAAPAAGQGSPWLSLLPSTRLRVEAGLAPAREGGDRFAAVLRVDGREGPRAVGGPS
ncbi:MBL fold metallo-hydrolase, partial [Actinospica acidiphila]